MNTYPAPSYSPSNPKIDFFDRDGKYLYSSNWYKSVKHAKALCADDRVGLVERATK